MTQRIDKDEFLAHARKLAARVRGWSERELRATYSQQLGGEPPGLPRVGHGHDRASGLVPGAGARGGLDGRNLPH
jgi:hypothetical protein